MITQQEIGLNQTEEMLFSYEVQTKTTDITVGDLYDLRERYDWELEYQREFVWGLGQQMLFIDSLIRGLPIQSLLMMNDYTATRQKRFHVTDGQQRQRTIYAFMDGKFPLMNEAQARSLMMRLPLIYPGKFYRQLPIPIQNRFRDKVLHIVTYDKRDKPIVEEIFMRTNRNVPLTVAEQLWIRSSRAKQMAIELLGHPIWETFYQGSNLRREPYQAALNTIVLEMFQRPVHLRARGQNQVNKLIYGDYDNELTETLRNTILHQYEAIMHLYQGTYIGNKSDIIPVYQSLHILEDAGFHLLRSEVGCCTEWFKKAKRGTFLKHIDVEWNSNSGRLDMLKEQEDFWRANTESLLSLPGLVRR